ncbi:MAG: FAD-dependent oxidoreductase [Betaproteobacteria bacterium]|nr:FAD-dependent oxidoreductase [Betaproteobacteria bacterium]
MANRLLIIGGVAAGAKAAAVARRRDPSAHIVLVQDELNISYSACGLPYWLAQDEGIDRHRLIARTPEAFARERIEVRTSQHVEQLDVHRASARICDRTTGRTYDEPYDNVLLATGAQAMALDIPRIGSTPVVAYLRSIADADHLSQILPAMQRAVIIGGGYIGLEMAETLLRRGLQVCLVEMMPRLLPNFAEAIGQAAREALEQHGAEVLTGQRVVGLDDGRVVLADGTALAADVVLAAMGVRPRTQLATAAGVSLGPTGAIAVDSRMATNVEHVYAAGDCVESRHWLTNAPVWMPLGDVANRQGRVAGINMTGGTAAFPGVLGTAIFRVFELAVARTGLNHAQALAAGFDPVTEVLEAPSRARYMRASRTLKIVLTVQRGTGLVLGGEVSGEDAVDKTVDILATAIWGKLHANDLADLDLAYAPPFSPVLAPVQLAGDVLYKMA